ncbi:MAG: EVE domain-containing protein [Solirubrobacteraceae bacterium]|nr:EVE domain-containing protein [Solirubrobacteraceae bacterium]
MTPSTPPPAADDPQSLSELLAELQATAEQLGSQLGDLGRLGRQNAVQQAEQLPAVRRVLEVAPPELRARLASAATHGLLATRDLADWLLAQMQGDPPVAPEPEELPITPIGMPRIERVPTTWVLTASVDNHAATESRAFSVIGIKERNRRRAMEIEPGDVLVLYLTKVMAFAGAIRVTGDLYEDREKIWPGQPKNPDAYPWRFPTEPVVALPRERWVPAEELSTQLEHVQKWPAEHWKLAFQGQLRTVSDHDAGLLLDRLHAEAGTPA